MTNRYLFLQEWAYIMFILLSFVILFTMFAFLVLFLFRLIKKCHTNVNAKDKMPGDKEQDLTNDRSCTNNKYMELFNQNHNQLSKITESSKETDEIIPKENAIGIFEKFSLSIKSYFSLIKPTRVASIEQLNNPNHLVTIKQKATSQSSSGSESTDTENEANKYINKNLSELESRFKKSKSIKSGRTNRTTSIDSSKKNSITSELSSTDNISNRKSSAGSDYYHSSMASLYKKRNSDVTSLRSDSNKSTETKVFRKFSVFDPMAENNGRRVSIEPQLSNADSYKHVAVPLDKSFIENEASNKATNAHKYFAESKVNPFKARNLSIAAPTSNKNAFGVPVLTKPRQSLPTDMLLPYSSNAQKFNPELSFKKSNLKLDSDSLTNSSNMDSAYISQNIDSGNENSALNLAIPTSTRRRASMCDPIILTEIQKDKYKTVVTEQSKEIKNSNDKFATIEFEIQYFSDTHRLVVKLLSLFDLNMKEINSQNELFLKCSLVPNKFSYDTKLFKPLQDTVLEENFEFNNLESSELDTSFLEIELLEFDKESKSNFLGSTMVQLNYSNIEMNSILVKDLKANPKRIKEKYNGELMVSLAYLPGAERLTINVKKAANLNLISHYGSEKKSPPDPYVKVCVFERNGKRLKKKKTSTEKSTVNPVFNQEIVFTNIKKDQLDDLAINFIVYNDSIKHREILGVLELGPNTTGKKQLQWANMISGRKSNTWWHNLEEYNENGSESQQSNSKYMGVMNFVHRKSISNPFLETPSLATAKKFSI